ncbi:hypothetical protein DYBT9275_03784 [Dyadobacter sp. CECT 9275]|uniref:Multidrug DMT transporter permease n=1 Tax=Dyadobacter helix TaxID=2822344 RepID=A0A916JEQ7_9BACT|nr:GRP family sugar transporter [Dyadobacter sp. CECT 9275]CAG5006285.1 hypothetical protein DYBT9275_03784 [Dyadobacter sp. CECT 9275]
MIIIETYTSAVIFCILTMLAWGSWPNTQKLVTKDWRFELFYWDFVFGIAVVAILGALTFGSWGTEGRGFFEDISQADAKNMLLASLGGVVFNIANILFVAAISIAGISVAFPVGAGVGLVLGVMLNYLSQPDGNGTYLFSGVFLIVLAIVLSAMAYRKISQNSGVELKGLLLAVISGVLFGVFYRFIAASMATNFVMPEAGLLGPYSTVVCFAAGILFSNLILNPIIMKKPIQGEPIAFSRYWNTISRNHWMGLLGGGIWGAGLLFSILSSEKAGFAVSFGLSQGNALIAALWGVLVWREFKGAPGVNKILFGMFTCYVLGLILIILSKVY